MGRPGHLALRKGERVMNAVALSPSGRFQTPERNSFNIFIAVDSDQLSKSIRTRENVGIRSLPLSSFSFSRLHSLCFSLDSTLLLLFNCSSPSKLERAQPSDLIG